MPFTFILAHADKRSRFLHRIPRLGWKVLNLFTRLLNRVERDFWKGAYEDFQMIEKAFLFLTQLLMTVAMWSFHRSLVSIVIPRNLTFLALGILWPFRKSSGSSRVYRHV
jgi:hypothetical protein